MSYWLIYVTIHMCGIAGVILLVKWLIGKNIDSGDVKIAFQSALLIELMLQGFHYFF